MEEYPEYWDTPVFYEDESDRIDTTISQIYKLCLEPTLLEVLPHIGKLLFINLIFRICTQIRTIPNLYCHIFSTICGISVLYCILKSLFYISIFIIFCYIVLNITQYFSSHNKQWPYYLSFLCMMYLIMSEFYFPLPQAWLESRGLHMVVAMKVISIAFDIKKGTIKYIPNIFEYAGYMYCPSNCLFGPWISFNYYKAVFNVQPFRIEFNWIKQIIKTILIAILFLTLSNCWAYYLIPRSWRWFVAYQEAFSFRSSHYFISYLSEAAMFMGGFGYINVKKKKDSTWNFAVTQPLAMELPRSLVQVVVYWNVPMHMWLKNYVFQVCKPMGSFFAVIMTYVISSFLHGFNLKLAAVLLSLGFYTFVEYRLRYKLSIIFNACIGANPCKKCEHVYQKHVYVYLVNFIFSAIAVFNLAYLGYLLENTTDTEENESTTFFKWQQLDFVSHLFTVFEYIVYKLI